MKHATKLFTLLVLLMLVFLPTASARAMGPFDGGPVIFGGSYTLESGNTLSGDLVVFGGKVTIEEDATVKGSIVIFGGNITLDGTMTQDLVLIGAAGSMGEKAVIEGDLVMVGGSMSRAEGARIEGEIRDETTIEIPAPTIPEVPQIPEVPPVPEVTQPDISINPLGSAFGVLGQAVLIAALAMLLSLFMRPQMERVADTLVRQPLVAGGVGLLTVFVSPLVALFMVVTIILILAVPFLALGLFLAWLFGLIAIGFEVGERFTRSIGQDWSPTLTAGFGTFLLVLIAEGVGLVPCVGWTVPFLLGATSVGAVVLTILDSRKRPIVAAPASSLDEPLPPAS
ncbi:MAG: hypothetical protein C4583_04055 [Anaerolineaceae bacterium]|nr:MAG: hypothetical protein C4583_04055 [Anaerolineaceae bacterium]